MRVDIVHSPTPPAQAFAKGIQGDAAPEKHTNVIHILGTIMVDLEPVSYARLRVPVIPRPDIFGLKDCTRERSTKTVVSFNFPS